MTRPASSRRMRRRLGATVLTILVALVGLLGAMIQAGWIPPPRDWFGTDPVQTTAPACPHSICLDPSSGPVGALVTVHGSGFAPDENVTMRLGEDQIGSAHTDGQGMLDTSLTIPRSYAGRGRLELTVTVLGETSGRIQSTVFVLTAA